MSLPPSDADIFAAVRYDEPLDGAQPAWPSDLDVEEEPPPPPAGRRRKRRPPVAAVALIGLAPVTALVVYEVAITGLMHDQRQQHLVESFNEPRPATAPGQAYGVLQIPKLSLNEMVIEGDDVTNLRSGPAHRAGDSPEPGVPGTVVILGRRSRFGAPFGQLDTLTTGDAIFLDAKDADVVEYRVVCNAVVSGERSALLDTADKSRIALVTAASGAIPTRHRVVLADAVDPSAEPPASAPAAAAAPAPCPEPASDAEAQPLDPDRGSLLFNREALLLYLGVIVSVLIGRSFRSRYSPVVRVVALFPVVAFTALMVLGFLDRILPGTL